jgi:hypothetical protein
MLLLGVLLMATIDVPQAAPATGPLRVSPDNPRHFCDPAGRVVYLTGSHTWSNLKDMGQTYPPPAFDYGRYLDLLQQYGHNFIRLWTWELTRYSYSQYDTKPTYAAPFPWPRMGWGLALDGRPKFDLSRFDEAYFQRLRERVRLAGERGLYVSIMLFEGHGIHASDAPWCWDGHPMHAKNNVNGINGDPNGDGRGIETQSLLIPEVTAIQEAYVRHVVDTVHDLDNVLYEIANESGAYSTDWQYHLIRLIHDYEQTKPRQHPVGMTYQWHGAQAGRNQTLFDSPADWVSPNPEGGYRDDPPAATGAKVIITDTDHLWGIGGNQQWVWKSFCRGLNPIFMDPCSPPIDHGAAAPTGLDPQWEPVRKSLGYTLGFARRMDLARATPRDELASTGYCLAHPGSEYLVYLPEGGEVTVDLTGVEGKLAGEWFNPSTGQTVGHLTAEGGARRALRSPAANEAVLYLHR